MVGGARMRCLAAVLTIVAFLATLTGRAWAQEQCPEGNVRWCWGEGGYTDGSVEIRPYSPGCLIIPYCYSEVAWLANEGHWLLGGCVELSNGHTEIIVYDESHVHDQTWLLEGPWQPLFSFCAVGYTAPIPQPEPEFVPEPPSLLLLLTGVGSLLAWARLRRS